MGEIESAAPGHEEFAAGRGHGVVYRHARAALSRHPGRHQPGGTGADDGDIALHFVGHDHPLC